MIDVFNIINSGWALIAGIVGLVAYFVTMNITGKSSAKALVDISKKLDRLSKDVAQIKTGEAVKQSEFAQLCKDVHEIRLELTKIPSIENRISAIEVDHEWIKSSLRENHHHHDR